MKNNCEIKISLVQSEYPILNNISEGKIIAEDNALDTVRRLVSRNTDIVCFNELFNAPYFCGLSDINWKFFAENIEHSEVIKKFQLVAAEGNIIIVLPFVEESKNKHYCTSLIIGNNGEIVGKYRKKNICAVEQPYFTASENPYLFITLNRIKIGLCLCFDRHFDEFIDVYLKNKPDIVFVPSSTATQSSELIWEEQAKTQAKRMQSNVAYINRVGKDYRASDDSSFFGRSLCASPDGNIVAQASSTNPEILSIIIK